MNEMTAHPEPDASGNPTPAEANASSLSALGWGLFGRFFFGNAGMLFLLAGIICFFAYNWEDMSAFAKFGTIAACMIASAAFPVVRGIHSASGRLGLLACGILGGALMAVYGQVYQTGANAWELFRSWALFLIPLALLGRQAGLWFALWLISSLWGIFYIGQRAEALNTSDFHATLILYQCFAQTGFFIAWETAAHFFSGPRFPFLHVRWLPRVAGFSLLSFLTFVLALHIIGIGNNQEFGYPFIYACLYLALIGGGAFYYRVRRTDLFMLACGLFSLIVLFLTFVARHLWRVNTTSLFFIMVVILLAGSAVSGKLLIARYRKWKDSLRQQPKETGRLPETGEIPSGETGAVSLSLPASYSMPFLRLALQGELQEKPETEENPDADDTPAGHMPWQARLLMGFCAWIAMPCMIALIFVIFSSAFGTLGYSVLFLMLLGTGIALSYLRGVFFEQAALCLCLTGAVTASILIASEMENRELYLLPGIIIFAASAFPVRNNAYRFLAATLAVTLMFFQLDRFFYPAASEGYMYFSTTEQDLWPVFNLKLLLFALLYSGCGVALAQLWRKRIHNGKLMLQQQPFMAALFATPLLLGVFPVLFHSSHILRALPTITGTSIRIAGIGAACGLGWLIFHLAKDLKMRNEMRIVMTLLFIPAAVISWYMPWFGVGLFMLAMSRQAKSIVLLGTATLFLAGCTVLEYYNLSTTLLVKSFSMGGIGLVLLLMALGLHQYMTKRLNKGQFPPGFIPASHRKTRPEQAISAEKTAPEKEAGRLPRFTLAGCLLVFFLFFSYSVQQKEWLLANGERVILALRPVDPRSLMQGDYMVLALDVENAIYQHLYKQESPENEPAKYIKGTAIVSPDENGVFRFVRLDDGTPLQDSQARLVYRGKKSGVRVGSGSFFFQEGYGKIFEKARFVELRAGKDGETLMTHLLDENRQRIDPKPYLAKNPA